LRQGSELAVTTTLPHRLSPSWPVGLFYLSGLVRGKTTYY